MLIDAGLHVSLLHADSESNLAADIHSNSYRDDAEQPSCNLTVTASAAHHRSGTLNIKQAKASVGFSFPPSCVTAVNRCTDRLRQELCGGLFLPTQRLRCEICT